MTLGTRWRTVQTSRGGNFRVLTNSGRGLVCPSTNPRPEAHVFRTTRVPDHRPAGCEYWRSLAVQQPHFAVPERTDPTSRCGNAAHPGRTRALPRGAA